RADVVALTVYRRRIVDLEKEFQQRAETRLRRIEHDLYRLGVAAVIAIGRVRHFAAGITHSRRDHARETADQILHSPKAAARQYCAFVCHQISSTWSI